MNDLPEPSVLDYVKSRLMPWTGKVEIPSEAQVALTGHLSAPAESPVEEGSTPTVVPASFNLPWRTGLGVLLALIAQFLLEPASDPNRWQRSLIFYALACLILAWAWLRREWRPVIGSTPTIESTAADPRTVRIRPLILSLVLAPLAFLAFGDNQFNLLNVTLWLVSLAAAIFAFWLPRQAASPNLSNTQPSVEGGAKPFTFRLSWGQKSVAFSLSRWSVLVMLVFLIAIFFRFSQLDQVPPEMNSDHAEKLLDVVDVLNGDYRIFFPRNTGREALQFYLIALTASILGTGISFLSMKIGTALAGLLTLPYIYLLGKEYGGRWAGLLALTLAAIAAWPNILSRVALRFSLYPLFAAPVLYHLLRGLRTGQRNQFILAGIFLGIGLHGYTPMRIVPLVILVAVGLYLLHMRDSIRRRQVILGLGILVIIAALFFLPLARFAQQYPDLFAYRAFTRLLDWEQPLPAQFTSLLGVLVQNIWNALIMPIWNTGAIWPVTVPGRPGLDVVSGVLFVFGLLFMVMAYLRKRRWEYLFLVLSVPLLMLPSSLSLAFPAENPAPNRLGGALVPVFVLAGIAAASLLSAFHPAQAAKAQPDKPWPVSINPWGSTNMPFLGLISLIVLLSLSAVQNYDLVFNQYRNQYAASAWNTSEMGAVIRNYVNLFGEPDTAWVVAVPHWADTRLVGIQAGQPTRDYAIFPENLEILAQNETRPLLFIVRSDDIANLTRLQTMFPEGAVQTYDSRYEFKDFFIFYTPGQQPLLP